jgi:hypothetical protein
MQPPSLGSFYQPSLAMSSPSLLSSAQHHHQNQHQQNQHQHQQHANSFATEDDMDALVSRLTFESE